MKKHLWKIFAAVAVAAVLAVAFWVGGDSPGSRGWQVEQAGASPTPSPSAAPTPAATPSPTPEAAPEPSGEPTPETAPETQPAPSATPEPSGESTPEPTPSPAPEPMPSPTPEPMPSPTPEPTPEQEDDGALTVTLSISCAQVWDNIDFCDPAKVDILPEDGWILNPLEVEFNEGESVFNILQRTCKQQRIPLEFSTTPLYNTAYIEGIGNLYQFDVGETSGWKFTVNGEFLGVSCSACLLEDGDVIEWRYACDLTSFQEDFAE